MPTCPAATILRRAIDLAEAVRLEATYLPNTLEYLDEEAALFLEEAYELLDDDGIERDERPASARPTVEPTYPWLKEQAI